MRCKSPNCSQPATKFLQPCFCVFYLPFRGHLPPPPLALFPYSRSAVIHRWRGELHQHSPQPAVNNCAPPKLFTVNNFIFTCTIAVNTPGPEDECRFLNARRLTGDFRSGPGALMQRNSQSLSPASQAGGDEPSIRTSILQGLRVQNNEPLNI